MLGDALKVGEQKMQAIQKDFRVQNFLAKTGSFSHVGYEISISIPSTQPQTPGGMP